LHSSYLSIVILLWSIAAGVHRKDLTADSCRTVKDSDVASAVSRVDCADTGISIVDVEKWDSRHAGCDYIAVAATHSLSR
jgi:hypothetical protein